MNRYRVALTPDELAPLLLMAAVTINDHRESGIAGIFTAEACHAWWTGFTNLDERTRKEIDEMLRAARIEKPLLLKVVMEP